MVSVGVVLMPPVAEALMRRKMRGRMEGKRQGTRTGLQYLSELAAGGWGAEGERGMNCSGVGIAVGGGVGVGIAEGT